MTDYAEFRLRIEKGPRPGTYRVEASGLGGESPGRFRVPFSDTELENFVLKIGRTRRGVRRIESPEMQAARAFGEKLFSAVMQGKTGELYRGALSEARATGHGLRITLSLTDVPELGAIPWEFLYDPPNFLSISTWTPVVRYLDLPKPRRPLKLELPLRILGVVSSPIGEESLNGDLERAKLEDALKPLKDANAVTIDWLEEATLLALVKKVRGDNYHIIHFIGHGGFDAASGEGALLFEDNTGHSRIISGDQLGTVLHDKIALRLVVLNSCEGARNSISDPFSGVATKLVQREVPAVIGMQFEITDRAAVLFASEFYAMLAEGKPVDSALAEARLAIFADQNDVEWGTPVLFMRVGDGRLFEIAHATAMPRVDPETLPPPVHEPEPEPGPDEVLPEPEPEAEAEPEPEPEAAEPTLEPEPEPEAEAPEPEPPVAPPVIRAGPVVAPELPPVIYAPPPTAPEPEPEPELEPPPGEPPPGEPPPVEPPPVEPPPPIAEEPPETAPAEETPADETPADEPKPEPKPGWEKPPPRRIPWRKVAVGVVVVVAVLTAIGLLLPPDETGSLNVSTAGSQTSRLIGLTGTGFAAGETVDISLDARLTDTAIVAADGTFTAQLAIGDRTSGRVDVTGRQSGNQAGADFSVPAGPASPTPESSEVLPSVAAGCVPPARPPSPGILYWSDVPPGARQAGDTDLYLIAPDTGDISPVTTNDELDSFPTWSTDYAKVAFTRGPEGARSIWFIDATGEHQVTSGPNDWYPTWSDDGWIAYVRGTETSNSIRAIRPDGSGDHEIVTGTEARQPAWSPCGGQLAFMGDLAGTGNEDLMIVNADGTGLDRLTTDPLSDRNPAWSPDGRTIVFVKDGGLEGDNDNDLFLLDVATKQVTGQLTKDNINDGNPVFSPDGTEIAFYRRIGRSYHIMRMNADGSGVPVDLMPSAFGSNLDPNWR